MRAYRKGKFALAVVAVIAVFGISGCSGPGAPLLRFTTLDGDGPQIPNCKNVSNKHKVDEYITGFYLSTWGSAFIEGAREGMSEGFEQAMGEVNIAKRVAWRAARSKLAGQLLEGDDRLLFTPAAFCRAYTAPQDSVAQIVSEILLELGNAIRIDDRQAGYFETEFIDRSHQAARWRDRYIIGLTNDAPERTVVRVARVLFISRGGGPYGEAISVGHNESWILKRIADKLN